MSDKLVITLQRTHENASGDSTFGKIFANGEFVCYTLEDKVRETAQTVAAWKIKGKTAIPSTDHPEVAETPGYRLTLAHSPRFGPDTLTLSDVPGFAFIRIHAGNTDEDTEGCPLLGEEINADGIVGGTSRPAVLKLKAIVSEAIRAGKQVWLEVHNIPMAA